MTLVVPGAPAPEVPPPSPLPASAVSASAPEPPPSATSTLAAENALLADALRLRREHHPERALARLDELLARYPSSPLVPTVRAERQRLVEAIANPGAHAP
jgi:type III secretory pathway lipoprotein EscJ